MPNIRAGYLYMNDLHMNREKHLLWLLCRMNVNKLVHAHIQKHVTVYLDDSDSHEDNTSELEFKAIVAHYVAFWNKTSLRSARRSEVSKNVTHVEHLYESSLREIDKALMKVDINNRNIELQAISVFDDIHEILMDVLYFNCPHTGDTCEVYIPVCQRWTLHETGLLKSSGWRHSFDERKVQSGTSVFVTLKDEEDNPVAGFYKITVEKGSPLDEGDIKKVTMSLEEITTMCIYLGVPIEGLPKSTLDQVTSRTPKVNKVSPQKDLLEPTLSNIRLISRTTNVQDTFKRH